MRRLSAVGLAALLILTVRVATQQIEPVQVLKISSGASGTEPNGVFRLTDERSVFSRATDREVIVLFPMGTRAWSAQARRAVAQRRRRRHRDVRD